MKIQIRRSSSSSKTGPVKVRQKAVYHCKECNNKYYSYYFFCPQCLGEVVSPAPHTAVLQIVSCPSEKSEAIELLKKLSENEEFQFRKALESLPWLCITNTDAAVLQHWKQCLQAHKVESEILAAVPVYKKRKRKNHPPL